MKQYYLKINSTKVPVSKEIYKEYKKWANQQYYADVTKKVEIIRINKSTSKVEVSQRREFNLELIKEHNIVASQNNSDVLEYITNKIALDQALSQLSEIELRVVNLYYFEEKTDLQISKVLGKSRQKIQRIRVESLQKLQKLLKE